MAELSVYDNDPTLYLFTSLTAGSSHVVTATSRIETILRANKIPFKGVDTATDDLARKLYGRRASGKKLPLLVKEGYVIGDLEMIEEWNEYGEIKDVLGVSAVPAALAKPAPKAVNNQPAAATDSTQKENTPAATSQQNLAIRQLGAEAAKVAASKKPIPGKISTTNPLLTEKVNSPALTTPKKSDPSGILSPRSIPLPTTPNPATDSKSKSKGEETVAKKFNLPKPGNTTVKMPPSLHADADNPDLDRGPIATSHKPPTSPGLAKSPSVPLASPSSVTSEERKSFHGSSIEAASKEEIKRVEQEQSIAEVSSSEEADSEDEESEEDESEDESEDGESEDVGSKDVGSKDVGSKKGKLEEDESDEEESEEEDSEEDDSEEDESEEDESEDEIAKPQTGGKAATTTSTKGEPKKTQDQDAKDATKAGESVKD